MLNKSSPLDAIQHQLSNHVFKSLRLWSHTLLRCISTKGTFLSRYRTASVTPLLKRRNLILMCLEITPILHTVQGFKILERLFLMRFRPHIERSHNFNHLQSASWRGHSNETTLVRILDDIYNNADNQSKTLFIQLDLSSVFDTLDHWHILNIDCPLLDITTRAMLFCHWAVYSVEPIEIHLSMLLNGTPLFSRWPLL